MSCKTIGWHPTDDVTEVNNDVLASHQLLHKAENDFTQALRAHTATVEKSNSNIKAIELIQCTSSHRGRRMKTLPNHRDSNVCCNDQSWLHIISEVAGN